MSGSVIDAVNYDPLHLALDSKNDPVRKVNELANLKRKLSMLRDRRASLRELLE
jgi:hypothetical protein